MTIELPEPWERFVNEQVASGRYGSPAEVIGAGLVLLSRAELKSAVEAGVAQADRGQVSPFSPTNTLAELRAKSASSATWTATIADLWESLDPALWDQALERYWFFVKPKNKALEKALCELDRNRLRALSPQGWYEFLRDEYFRWKYTAPNRYASTTLHLKSYVERDELGELDLIRQRILSLDPNDIRTGLETAKTIRGLGTAGASGLLALIYPETFGTVDQFVVKALREVRNLPESAALARMKPEILTLNNGVLLIDILQRKAKENNQRFGTSSWTPRRLDMALWTYGREK
jgi:putative addiction module CopG family antidote